MTDLSKIGQKLYNLKNLDIGLLRFLGLSKT